RDRGAVRRRRGGRARLPGQPRADPRGVLPRPVRRVPDGPPLPDGRRGAPAPRGRGRRGPAHPAVPGTRRPAGQDRRGPDGAGGDRGGAAAAPVGGRRRGRGARVPRRLIVTLRNRIGSNESSTIVTRRASSRAAAAPSPADLSLLLAMDPVKFCL